ncbi:hypothetical protein [Kribbella sp. DT2]|uniref:hypothetical protein n=1 Tax=Kribbella sp. DT2 TaxID=3393427 RepID=UPI003CEDE424
MTKAEFEEKQYESAFNIELAGGHHGWGDLFSAGQVLEKILGFDGAGDAEVEHRVWQVLKVPRPTGLILLPEHWEAGKQPPPDRLPIRPVSVVLQYKRPEYLIGNRAAQWTQWGRPYYRIRRESAQHSVLKHLEQSLVDGAIVRYAAPAFWKHTELEAHRWQRTVLPNSGFVAPSVLGSHKVWTYEQPGTDGFPNPDGPWQPFESVDSLSVLLQQVHPDVRPGQLELADQFGPHLRQLADALTYRRPRLRSPLATWEASLRNASQLDLPIGIRQQLILYATVQSTLHQIGASWHLSETFPG